MAIFVAAIVATMSVGVHAQTQEQSDRPSQHEDAFQPHGPVVTLESLLQEAMDRNPELAVLRQQTAVARERPAQDRGLSPPMVEAQIWQWPINTWNPANVNMYMFTISQDLPGRGKRDLRAAVAQKDLALAETDVTIRARQLVVEVKQAYAALFIARKAIDVYLASVDVLRQIADVTQTKYATGRISQQDVLKPVVELSKLHGDLLAFDEQAALATARLNVLIGRVPETPIGPLVEPREEILLPATDALQRMALDRQPDLRRVRLETERAEAELSSAQSDYKPDFSLQGGYMLLPSMTDAWTGRIGVTWPSAPWSRGRIDAKVAEQHAALDAAKDRARAMEQSVRLSVQQAYVRARSAQQRAALLRSTILPESRQALDVSRVAYQADRVDFQALLDNERMLLGSQLEYFRALSDFTQAMADLERAIGTDLPLDTTTAVALQEGQ
jgi:outer membrane protein TolC